MAIDSGDRQSDRDSATAWPNRRRRMLEGGALRKSGPGKEGPAPS